MGHLVIKANTEKKATQTLKGKHVAVEGYAAEMYSSILRVTRNKDYLAVGNNKLYK